jgi:Tol biopolymer transport system component
MRKAVRRTSLVCVAACAAVAVCAGGASASLSRGKLVLVGVSLSASDFQQQGLYVVNADGSGLRQLTHSDDEQPHWSRDGRWIAFVHDPYDSPRFVIVHGDGSGRRVLGRAADLSLSAANPWSPDGKRIAWGGCGGLCVFDLASSLHSRIPLGDDNSGGFSWSPDGRRLAAVDRFGRLVVVDLSGAIRTVLSVKGQSPAWSPNGKQVAFRVGGTLELVSSAGGAARVLARDAASAPSWSRNGRRLLYTAFTRSAGASVQVLNVATGTKTRVGDTGGAARWSPDDSAIAYTRARLPLEQDVWTARPDGAELRQLTAAFPTGVSYDDLDWTAGSVPVASTPPRDLLPLTATGDLRLQRLYGIRRAATPDSVVYVDEVYCDAEAMTESASFNLWTPSAAPILTTSTPCQDWPPDTFAVTSSLVAWVSQSDLNGNETLDAVRLDTTEPAPIARWTSGEEAPDIGWRAGIGRLVGGGSLIVFETWNWDGTHQLWRIVDGAVPHAVPVPLPPDATYMLDADAGRIVVRTADGGLAVLSSEGTALSRVHYPTSTRAMVNDTVRLGGDLLGAVGSDNTLRVYAADDGSLRYQLPLAHASGAPRLLTIWGGHAVYASGIELHLVRLQDGLDRILDLAGQAGPLDAILTTKGLFVSYYHAYDPQPGHILFVPTANLP